MSQGPSLVLEWLSKLHLAQYLQAFVDNGYDDLEVCKQIGDPDLDAIGVQIQFHRHRLLTAVHRLQDGKNRKSAGYYFTLEPLDGDRKLKSGLHESSCPGKHNLKLSHCNDFVTYPKLKLKVLLRDRLSKDGINLGEAPYSHKASRGRSPFPSKHVSVIVRRDKSSHGSRCSC
ncbi:Sterile alpha motif domain containing protein 5 [Dissostichus eleginoides]|uniref:Sterile alpha motif domain-containing protein 5 n=1 Tax=Dissostichus eleginoides TaxID=100907 RepID=A0AAD9C249_DISEL|nr:Sterile alpha motif domain containing protein 5 [Dissostichus eleginoides]